MKERLTRHFGGDWAHLLGPFLNSSEFEQIGRTLLPLKDVVTPNLSDVFRCFRECPVWKLHTVIVNTSAYAFKTYSGELTADGLALSARNDEDVPILLEEVYKCIDETIYANQYLPGGTYNDELEIVGNDLVHWARQGILLLNCSLTTIQGKENEHNDLWRPFVQYVIKAINEHRDAIGYILMGSHAMSLQPLITNQTHQVFTCESPMAARYYKRSWKHNDAFRLLHNYHVSKNNNVIKW